MQSLRRCGCCACGRRGRRTADPANVRVAIMWFSTCRPPLQTLLCAAILLLMATSAGSFPVLSSRLVRRQATDSRELCWHTNNTCQFYSHCIDSLFHCGNMGFASAFAEGWCEAIRLFRSSQENCATCLTSSQLDSWTKDHEQCFQRRLYALVTEEFTSRTPDPPTCLHLERRAFQEMEECYRSTGPQLCSALAQSQELELFQRDIAKVAGAFHVNDYYGSASRSGLSDTISSCDHPDSSAIAQSVVDSPAQRRVVFCGAYKKNGEEVTNLDVLNNVFLKKIAGRLNQSSEQFTYEGSVTDTRCKDTAPLGVPENLHFHFVTWRPSADNTLPDNLETQYAVPSTATNLKFFDYNISSSLCGDGVRQAGEVCDSGVYNGAGLNSHTHGCTSTCVPVEGFECTGDQLGPSRCWMQECGNRRRESAESCDDGNNEDNDGCSSDCQIEPDFRCSTEYNKTSSCEEHNVAMTTIYPIVSPTPTIVHSPSVSASYTPTLLPSRTNDLSPTSPTSPPPTIDPSFSTSRSRTLSPNFLLTLILLALCLVVGLGCHLPL